MWQGNIGDIDPASVQVTRLRKIRVEAYHVEILQPIWQLSFASSNNKSPFNYVGAGFKGADEPTDPTKYARVLDTSDPTTIVAPVRTLIGQCAGARPTVTGG